MISPRFALPATRRLLAVAVTSLAAAVQAAPPTGLAPGKAKGSVTVNGTAVTLTHAYAALEPNPFDQTKSDIVVVLTNQPLDAAALAGTLSEAMRSAKIYMTLKLRDDPDRAKMSGFLNRWVVGNRMLAHDSLKGKVLQSSPDFDSKVDAVVAGPDRVEATVYTEQPASSMSGDKIEYRVAFNAAVKPKAAK
jgi:hypothetical protein